MDTSFVRGVDGSGANTLHTSAGSGARVSEKVTRNQPFSKLLLSQVGASTIQSHKSPSTSSLPAVVEPTAWQHQSLPPGAFRACASQGSHRHSHSHSPPGSRMHSPRVRRRTPHAHTLGSFPCRQTTSLPLARSPATFPVMLEELRAALGSRSRPVGKGSPPKAATPLIRLVLIRHAQSANKKLERGERPSKNPGLTELGLQQASALGTRLRKEFGPRGKKAGKLVVVSSPMRRCLYTILPFVQGTSLKAGDCLCHGGAYEFGCAGADFRGSTAAEVCAEFPEFSPVEFSASGLWDYRGSSAKETQEECRSRIARLAAWLRTDAITAVRDARAETCSERQGTFTIVLCLHQTTSDLLCQILVDGTSSSWEYGDFRYSLRNTAVTEVFLHGDGTASFGDAVNDDQHTLGIRTSLVLHGRRDSVTGARSRACTT